MIAFLAATPYQVLNCINIALSFHSDEEKDIYLLLFAVDLRKIAQQLRESNLFRRVIILERFATLPGKQGILHDFIWKDRELKQALKDAMYGVLYITYIGDRCNEVYNQMLRKNPKMKLRFYDEGIGIYTVGYYQSSANMRRLMQALRYRYVNDHVEAVYVYQPSMMMSGISAPIIQIPPFRKADQRLLDQLNMIFCDRSILEEQKRYSLVFLEQCFDYYLHDDTSRNQHQFSNQQLLELLGGYCSAEDILVKLHPITDPAVYEGFIYQFSKLNHVPWEIIVFNMPDIEDKTLVTVHSTAALTPKILFDEEPVVIILAKALYCDGYSNEIWNPIMETLFSSFQQCYRNPEKVIIPASMEELRKALKNLIIN